ncbi:MAG: hypothetical protein LBE75_06585 [Burkholderiales bacterium]|jgi:hypothetical protein|nr:hypothetical protein [Burkholderiales bacterium]
MRKRLTSSLKLVRRAFFRGAVCGFGVFAGGLLFAGHAAAEICVYESNAGQMLYTNVSPGPDWKKRQCFATAEPPAAAPKKGVPSATARSTLPKVTSEKQRERDAMRRKVIEDELAAESALLEEARGAYANGAPPALAEEFLNPQKYSARIARLRESVDLHERNVEALRKEVAKM